MKKIAALFIAILALFINNLFSQSSDSVVTIYGPMKFERSTGKPETVTKTFTLPATVKAPYVMYVQSGSPDGEHAAASATVALNGLGILSPSDFNGHPQTIQRAVDLVSSNTVSVKVASKPGTFLLIWFTAVISDITPPVLTITSPDESAVTGQQSITVTGTVTDESAVTVTVNGAVVSVQPDGAFSAEVNLLEGTNTITVVATDAYNNHSTTTRNIILDVTPPAVNVFTPLNDTLTNQSAYTVAGVVTDLNAVAVSINGTYLTIDADGSFSHQVSLAEGMNTFTITAEDAAGNVSSQTITIIKDSAPPQLTVSSPEENTVTSNQISVVSGTVSDSTLVTLTINGDTVDVADGAFSGNVTLSEGSNTVTITATDAAGNSSSVTRTITLDTTPPTLTVTLPPDNSVTNQTPIEISGTVVDSTAVTVTVNGSSVPVSNGSFSMLYTLAEGLNSFSIVAADAAGNSSTETRTVRLDTQAPIFANILPENGIETRITPAVISGVITDSISVSLVANGDSVSINSNGSFTYQKNLAEGPNIVTLVAVDEVGNTSTEILTINFTTLPPDPIVVAPPLDTTVTTNLCDASKFLYSGIDKIQFGLDTSALVCPRITVLKGKVLADCGIPLSGVNVSILGHPEFGYTLSRKDGEFDLVTNGGGLITLRYSKQGFLPAQRQINTPWLDYISADSVMMIAVDPNVTTISSNIDSVQSAQTSVVSDADGTRRSTIIFERFTQGMMAFSDGTTQSLPSFSLRGTEYGTALECVKALPGTLPPQSALGYGIELNCDEAINTNARLVSFDKPFALYVDNFLALPTGSRVPTAYFDSTKGLWMPVNDGRVVKIISIVDGIGNLDVTGSGSVSPQSSYDSLGITLDERTRLASLFTAGQSFMRIETNRLGPWSFSWPFGPPLTAKWPSLPAPTKQMLDKDCTTSGSIIGIQNQSLGETLPITGTPFSIYYKSTRVPGRTDAFALDIPLTGSTLPPGLLKIYLKISIAGQIISREFIPAQNLSYNFVWNGKDAYGRRMQGKQTISTSIGYSYQANFQIPTGGQSFGNTSGNPMGGRRSYTTSTLWQHWSGLIGMWNETSRSLGSWSLNIHHLYDAVGKTLHLGDGNTRSAENANLVVTTIAGNGRNPYYWELLKNGYDGQPASELIAGGLSGLAVGPDGSIYFCDVFLSRVFKIKPDGTLKRIAGITYSDGTAVYGYNGDSIPATSASLNGPVGLALASDGSLYIGDKSNNRIRKIDTTGLITTVGGTGVYALDNDGKLAVNQAIAYPIVSAIGPDGSIYYIAGNPNFKIHKINPSGMTSTFAGNGATGYIGDNMPATKAAIFPSVNMAVGKDGTVYLGGGSNLWSRVWGLGPDGIARTVAGNGQQKFSGDCGPALSASIQRVGTGPTGMDKDGNLYVSDMGATYTGTADNGIRIRRISSGGIISTIAGNIVPGYNGENLPATSAQLGGVGNFAIKQDGTIYFTDGHFFASRIRKISKPFPQFSSNTNVIPSEDGSELFVFDYSGRHQQTVDALTGVVKLDFYYDSKGRLTHIRDIDSLFTTIERDSVTGEATAIISPYGQKTYLYINNSSYLDSLTNPAGETHRFTYDDGGLMKTMRNAKSQLYKFTYDSLGRLIKDEDPLGGFKALSRSEIYDNGCSSCGKIGFEVTMTTALGKKTINRVERIAAGGILITNTDENGQKTYTRENPNGTTTITSPDSTVITVTAGPDPRFGMMVPVDKNKTTRKPSGLTMTESHGRKISQMTGLQVTGLTDSSFVNGRLSKSEYNGTTRTITSTSPMGRKKVSFLDMKGRVIKDSIPGITPTVNVYNSKGQLVQTKQGTRITNFTYDDVGRLASIQDPMLRISNTLYDSVGRTLQQILPDGRTIGYSYDANSNIVSLTPPSKPAHEFGYNDVDQKTAYNPPPLQVDGATPTGYEYNLDKQKVKVTRADSATLVFAYDTTGDAFGGNMHLKTLTFDRGTITYDYNTKSGIVARIVSADKDTLLYTYDGTMPIKKEWRGNINGFVSVQYDNNFRVIAQKVNGGDSIGYIYNTNDQLTKVGDLKIVYNSINELPIADTVENVSTAILYNAFGEVFGINAKYAGSSIFTTSYTRDSLGRITTLSETIQGESKTFRYGYDLAGRLEKVWRNDNLAATYFYDSTGNRIAKITPSTIDSGKYDVQDRMLSYGGVQYVYTKNGDLQKKIEGTDTTIYTYDALGNLVAVRLPNKDWIEYLIDGNNRRVGKKLNGQTIKRWIYENDIRPIAELDSGGNITARYIYGLKDNVPEYIVKGGLKYRIITDHIGSVRLAISTISGTILSRFDYDEYGNITHCFDSLDLPFAYSGGLYDSHTKLIRFGARDYDALVGRWTCKDPIGFDAADVNFYVYTSNNPVNFVDHKGMNQYMDAIAGAFTAMASLVGMIDAINDIWDSKGSDYMAMGSYVVNNFGMMAGVLNFAKAITQRDDLRETPDNPVVAFVVKAANIRSSTVISIAGIMAAGALWAKTTHDLGELTGNYALKFSAATLSYLAINAAGMKLAFDLNEPQ